MTPHMCTVCWVNDHMYCRNMKRISRDLPTFSAGCIHYIVCEHFRQSGPSVLSSPGGHRRSRSMPLHWTNHPDGERVSSCGIRSAEDLFCDEDMLDSESDVSCDSVEGTELLQIQLKARAAQIFRSLGISELPKTVSPPPMPPATSASREEAGDDVDVEPEEYAAEIVLDSGGDCIPDGSEILCPSSDTITSGSPQELPEFDGGSEQSSRCLPAVSGSTCSEISFDGTSPHEPAPVNTSMAVHVCSIDANRVVIRYPKQSTSPREYAHLDVTFPNGATDEVVNSYVKNDVARFMCKNSASDCPLSVTVVRDSEAVTPSAVDHSAPSAKFGHFVGMRPFLKTVGWNLSL